MSSHTTLRFAHFLQQSLLLRFPATSEIPRDFRDDLIRNVPVQPCLSETHQTALTVLWVAPCQRHSRCAGTLEVKHDGDWRPVGGFGWTLKEANVVCRNLDCGSAVSVVERKESSDRPVWLITSNCVQSGSSLRDCALSFSSSSILNLTCSGKPINSVRLVDGTSPCSGRLEVKSDQSNQLWSSVCEDDFDQQDAEVVCRELGCGAPSVLQGALYGEVEAPTWTKEFQCGGHESALLDCRSSGSARNTCSPGKAVGLTCSGRRGASVRLLGGGSRCAGTLEVKHKGDWRPVWGRGWNLKRANVVCRYLDCGSAVSVGEREDSSDRPVWLITSDFFSLSLSILSFIICPDSVRLVDGTSPCSGRLEVKSDQSNQWWSSVCEDDFDQQDAEVVCRELGCGAPSVLQGALYGEVEAPMWTKEFQCGGHESALLDCRSSGSARNTCSPGKAVGLTCSGRRGAAVRLVGGGSRCAGTLELKHKGDWTPVKGFRWTLEEANVVCRNLDCGSGALYGEVEAPMWTKEFQCGGQESALLDCRSSGSARNTCSPGKAVGLTCSGRRGAAALIGSFLLVGGDSRCAGTLELKHDGDWRPVRDDFDQQDAEVVCRELGCGAPSVLQGALYGEVEAPMWTKEFQCGGHESALLDCRSSGSARNTCSPGKAVGLTCSESVRLVGGDSRCAGTLELKQSGDWRPTVSVVCLLICQSTGQLCIYRVIFLCSHRDNFLDRCRNRFLFWVTDLLSLFSLSIICPDSVRLVDGTSPCSGRLEVKSDQSNQWWSSVCEDDFDQQDAEVVCRELGCGAPSVLQGALYGEVEAPMWTKEFQCGGHESALLDCRSSGSARNTCSPGKAVGLTCSGRRGAAALIGSFLLLGGDSRCAGTLELKHNGDWRPVDGFGRTLKEANVVCRNLDCGSAVSVGERKESSDRPVWLINSDCVQSGSSLRECATSVSSSSILNLTCSGKPISDIINDMLTHTHTHTHTHL
uniref:SRCR domain-containing protein n=1 Tax=Dicentrarchus labrax TaxID=13489 RepID=A0A8C4F4Z5_DICLA